MIITAFSDTHGQHEYLKIPVKTDVLIFAGDFSGLSDMLSTIAFYKWFQEQPGTHKILVPGNHDYYVESMGIQDWCHVLINSWVSIDGYMFFGSPYTPTFMNWNYMKSEAELSRMYEYFPEIVEILITHGPPYNILDNFEGDRIGSTALRNYVDKIQPLHHIFGHNHEKGSTQITYTREITTNFHNVAVLDQDYILRCEPTIIEV